MVTRNRVQDARKRCGITISELARRVKVSRQTIYSIEGEEGYIPKADLMFALARALNTDVGSLFWDEVGAVA